MSEIDKLVDQLKNRKIDRRQFVIKGAALGVSFTALGSILAACGGGTATPAATETSTAAATATTAAATETATATAAATETATAAATETATATAASAGGAQETVKIVVTSPQTGGQAQWGTELIRGTELALGDYDASTLKFKYEIVPMDDQADPKVGMTVANKVAADPDVMAVVGPWNSGVAIPASPVYNQARVPLFAVASDPKLTQQGFDNIFRVGSTNDFQAIGAEAFAFNTLKKTKVAMIYEKTIPGQGLADYFKTPALEDGMQVVAYEGETVGDKDFTALLTAIKPKNPDLIWMPATYPEGSQIIKQMKDLGYPQDIAIIGADGMYTDEVIKLAGDAAEGVYATALGGDVNKMDSASTFVSEFKATTCMP
ncbi:MAG: branched-chain amino acid ABC transporter substrate-binding protein, partial [Chloroflexi bacterium]|nr:branched-chain amino acid ABC transporter substrate-binding protein [Chloroflexota bacterium]